MLEAVIVVLGILVVLLAEDCFEQRAENRRLTQELKDMAEQYDELRDLSRRGLEECRKVIHA